MAKYDLRVVNQAVVKEHNTDANSTAINAGEPVVIGGALTSGASASNYAAALTDGKPVIGTDQFAGIATVGSTHTASVDGVVSVARPFPQITEIWGAAKSAAAIDTAAELLGVLFDAVLFDLTSSTYTIDQAAAANTSGLMIIDGNTAKGELGVVVDGRAMRKDIS